MRKLLLAVVAIATLSACQPQSSKNGGGMLLNTEREYEIDSWGTNPDIYEFTPIGHEHMTCLILVSGVDNASGIHCFPKKVPSK